MKPITEVRVHRNDLRNLTYSVSCNWGDGRYHVWVDAATKKMKPLDNKLYKNPLPGQHFDTRYLKAGIPKNAEMIRQLLATAEANNLFEECDAKLREQQEAQDRENHAAYLVELKKQAGPKLYEALRRLTAKMEQSGEAWMSDPDWRFAAEAIDEADGKGAAHGNQT